jgi:hypothetical protein
MDKYDFDFPITQSFPARATALFLMGPLSDAGDEIMFEFPEMAIEERVYILQRTMAVMVITSKWSFQFQSFLSYLGRRQRRALGLCTANAKFYIPIPIVIDTNRISTEGQILRTFSAQANLVSRMSENDDQFDQWDRYKEAIGYDCFGRPAVRVYAYT